MQEVPIKIAVYPSISNSFQSHLWVSFKLPLTVLYTIGYLRAFYVEGGTPCYAQLFSMRTFSFYFLIKRTVLTLFNVKNLFV